MGLSLALGLAHHGVRSVLIERKERTSERSKAPAIQQRTREVFRQWDIEDRFLAAGTLRSVVTLHSSTSAHRPLATLDFSELANEADHPGLLLLEQAETESLLLEVVRETGCAISTSPLRQSAWSRVRDAAEIPPERVGTGA
ncbi:FAD-dependent oxidoreductase [Chelativorans sp. M5D2P16]|uniref:FAD-dependent oxidoreductase n=1 Tax=Chelativorans sp. M5D2P16 TaxID=3095678 RepID=UPI002ACA2EA9|nr:FAD-dependent monooxygenase [Chelativorans sp. M5D2P16]MDZ5696108.1 FAD-dependent monooxygenase [Chelativorans sp. M5D2P16]